MKYYYVFIFIVFILPHGYSQNIYNDGTAWKMPRTLTVSNFYYDIENAYQYEGRHQEKYLKIKSFFWQDPNNENISIESAFFIVKRFATGGGVDYAFQYRRYVIYNNEQLNSDIVRIIRNNNKTEIQRGATLYLNDSDIDRFSFGMPHRTGWDCIDGLYEKYNYSMFFENIYVPIFDKVLNRAGKFEFNFPSELLETNGFVLEEDELEKIRINGYFTELENNKILLTTKELENLWIGLAELMKVEKQSPNDYLEQVMNDILK